MNMDTDGTRRVVALVATPNFKKQRESELRQFAYRHLYTLTSHFTVISTGRTYEEIQGFLNTDLGKIQAKGDDDLIAAELGRQLTQNSLEAWRSSIRQHFEKRSYGVQGMIEIASELVQGKVDAIIQFSLEDDMTVRAGSAVLRREANVHDVPIASDMCTADTLLGLWKNKLRRKEEIFFRAREKKSDYRALLQETSGDRVVALIAHDKQKVAMSQFVMEHAEELREYFDYVLATDSTGKLARKALQGCRWTKEELKRILLCNSGPEGGDVEIAALVIHGHCRHVFFFQDPATSHPHEADIRLFEQAIPEGINARMASNPASAKILLDSVRREAEQKRAYGTPNLTGRIRGAEAVRNGPSRGRARQRPTR